MIETILQTDTNLLGNQARYKLTRPLGRGKYSQVWLAEVISGEIWLEVKENPSERVTKVAVKIMKPDLIEADQRHFWSEIEILQGLQKSESEQDLRVNGYSLVPTIFDYQESQDYQQPSFFVQTFASGQPLDELLREQGTLPEPEALTIVSQFCRVLQGLHQGLKRSYLDFQPRNIFWDAKQGRILVVDWNLLTRKVDFNPQEDLLATAQMLYRALIGVPVRTPGSRRSLAEPQEQWGRLSLAAQAILTRAFHPNSERQYRSAPELQEDLERLLHYWEQCSEAPEDFLQGITVFIPKQAGDCALNETDRNQIDRAANMLSIASRMDLDVALTSQVADLKSQIEPWMTGRGALENGIKFFDIADYEAAMSEFERAVEEAWDSQAALRALRWLQITQAAQDQRYNESDRAKAKQGLLYLAQDQHDNCRSFLESLPGHQALEAVKTEVQIRTLLQQVERLESQAEFEAAFGGCQQASRLMFDLPSTYQDILREQIGNLTTKVAELGVQLETAAAVQDKIKAIEETLVTSFEQGQQMLKEELDSHLGYRELVKWLLGWIDERLGREDYAEAEALAALGLEYTYREPDRSQLLEAWHVSQELIQMQEAWEARDFDRLEDAAGTTGLTSNDLPRSSSQPLAKSVGENE